MFTHIDAKLTLASLPSMAPKPDKAFVRRFCTNTRRARVNANLTMRAIAEKLGIPARTYEKYEARSTLPDHLKVAFCIHTGVSLADLFMRPDSTPKRRA
jgi:transcriptional regulator with XRE-family HTH domain